MELPRYCSVSGMSAKARTFSGISDTLLSVVVETNDSPIKDMGRRLSMRSDGEFVNSSLFLILVNCDM